MKQTISLMSRNGKKCYWISLTGLIGIRTVSCAVMPPIRSRLSRNYMRCLAGQRITARIIDPRLRHYNMSNKKSIVTGILSYGMSGRVFHAPFIDGKTRFDLRAVVERREKRAKQRYPDIISYDSVDDLLNDDAIELVIVNTPNNLHVEHATKALKAGKHILVEKPFATSSAEARQLFELGRSLGRHVMVFQNRRWDSDFKLLK